MADEEYSLQEEAVFGLAVLRSLYAGRSDLVQQLNEGWNLLLWSYLPEYELPSVCVLGKDGDVRVFMAGTTNGWQGFGHLRGYLGHTYGTGAVNRSWRDIAPRMVEKIAPYLPDRSDSVHEVTVWGHSYGSALAQIVADLEADAGRNMARWRVIALASPKPYTTGVPELRYRVDIIRSSNDVVTAYPFSFAPVYQVDPWLGVIPFSNPFAEWDHRGNVQTLDQFGNLVDDAQPRAWDTNEDYSLSFAAHEIAQYIQRLELRRKSKGWLPGVRYQKALQAIEDASTGSVGDLDRSLTWFPQNSNDPVFEFLSGFSRSKGSSNMTAAIECVAHLKCGDYGWTESLYFYPSTPSDRTFDKAKEAWQDLLSARLGIFAPVVEPGKHIVLQATRYMRDDGSREGYPDWTPETEAATLKKNSDAGSIEPPFVGYLYRLYAGLQNSRNYLFRPIPNTQYMNQAGVLDGQAEIRKQIEVFLRTKVVGKSWAIKCINKSIPKKDVIAVQTGALAPGLCDLVVPAHGYSPGQELSITGGGKARKALRGKVLVFAAPGTDTIRIQCPVDTVAGPVKMKVQALEYHYPIIQTWNDIRISKRDTGAPIAPGRGRQ